MTEETQKPDPDEMIEVGIQAAKLGNRETARAIFQQVLDTDRRNERALLWMASVAPTMEERQRYLRAVLKVNAKNRVAREQLARLQAISINRDRKLVRYGLIAVGMLVLAAFVLIVGALVLSSIL